MLFSLRQPASALDGFLIAHAHTVDVLRADLRQRVHAIPAALNPMLRSLRFLHHEALRRRIGLLECGRAAGESPSGAREIAEHVDCVRRLRQDLRTRMAVVRAEIGGETKLIGAERPSLLNNAPG